MPTSSADASPREALRDCLTSLGLPRGLLAPVLKNYDRCDSRLWLLDNSARMKVKDSHVGDGDHAAGGEIERKDNVTRWEELRECVAFHAKMAGRCWIPSKYYLVNDPTRGPDAEWCRSAKTTLCMGERGDFTADFAEIRRITAAARAGLDLAACPLRACLRDLRKGVELEAAALEARGRHVTVVLCTQGRPTDRHGHTGAEVLKEFVKELKSLAKLPVKVIVRLCTDTEEVRDMFNALDNKVNSVDVLDDFWGEAREVYLYNPWLTYTMGMHRLRESGLAPAVMDDLDEEPLDPDALHELCRLLFESRGDGGALPHPRRDGWPAFFRALTARVVRERPQWNPIKKKRTPWINLAKLDAMHRRREASQAPRQRRNTCSAPPPARRGDEPLPSRSSSEPQWQSKRPPRQSKRQPAAAAPPPVTLPEALRQWSHQPPSHELLVPLGRLLVTVPDAFPPMNAHVEPHEYFAKWKTFDEEAFADESGDELKELLKRAVRKVKFFLHPDKLPKDLTENQKLLFETIWHVIQEQEEKTLS